MSLSKINDLKSNLVTLSPAQLIDLYAQGAEQLIGSVSHLTDEQLRARPIPGKWSILEVVCHLADFELVNADRFQRVLAEESPTLFNAVPDQFLSSLKYEHRQLKDELQLIKAVRIHITTILRNQPETAWSRKFIHSVDGELSLLQLLQRATKHILHHLPFIEEKRAALVKRD